MTYTWNKVTVERQEDNFYAVREIFLHLFVIFYAAILNQIY